MHLSTSTVIVFIFQHISLVLMQGVPISPCPKVFQYRYDGTEWYGILSVRNPDFGQPLHLRVTLSMRGKPATNYLGEIELLTRGQYFSDAPVFYKIKFPKSHFPPKLVQITANNQVVCIGAADQTIFVTQIQLEHTRKFTFLPQEVTTSNQPSPASFLPDTLFMESGGGHSETKTKEFSMLPTNSAFDTKHLPFSNVQKHPMQQLKDSCGKIDERIRFQVLHALKQAKASTELSAAAASIKIENPADHVDGERKGNDDSPPLIMTSDVFLNEDDDLAKLPAITRGAWPWLAAVYVNNLTSLAYQCGGTLVSSRVVISAAHCFHLYNQRYTANEVLVFLGRHNLKNWNEEGSLAAPVEDIFIHPDFNQNLNSFDADIAVVYLKNEVRFNTFIRPACLWSGSTNKEYIEGEHGVLIGWSIGGLNMSKLSSASSTVPKIISAPIVSDEVCFQENPLYHSLSSNRTFCAGTVLQYSTIKTTTKTSEKDKKLYKIHQGPCTGDSGAGLMIFKNKRWMLRGTVSGLLPLPPDKDDSSKGSKANQSCSQNQFVIYTDVAEFLDWILAFLI